MTKRVIAGAALGVALVSGDHAAAAAATAQAVGIDEVIAEVDPAGKVREVARRAAAGERVGGPVDASVGEQHPTRKLPSSMSYRQAAKSHPPRL
jgi:hypothetical protein